MENLTNPFVSVIVPVFNDADRLKICLEALENQTYPQNLYEVIVVDNVSDKSQNIEEIVTQYDRAIYAYESIPGSYAARNKGISLAQGEILAFTDADCIPASNWLEKGVSYLLKVPNCGLVAGKIELFFQDPNRPTAIELYESLTAFPQEKLLERERGGATANIFTFKEVFERVGLFNPNLKSNGDLEWGKRVFAGGYWQVYTDDSCVKHPARSSWLQLYKRTIRLAGGLYDRRRQEQNSALQYNLIFLKDLCFNFMPPLRFVGNTFVNSKIKNLHQKITVSLVMFFVRYVTLWELFRLKLGGVSARE
jgi:glycosyltransferase involved in cell wall biosynthesis